MVLNRSHIPWAVFVALVTAASALLYLANVHPDMLLPFQVKLPKFFGAVPPPRNTVGGTPLGLVFGIVSLAIFLFAAALGIRKKQRTWLSLGNVQWWLKAHIWLTILTLPFVGFHCDFKSGGPMTTTLVVLYAIVMVSGFVGIGLQQFMPKMMTQRLNREVVYEQIPFVREKLVQKAEALWQELAPASKRRAVLVGQKVPAAGGPPVEEDTSPHIVGEFLHDECFPYLRAKRGDRHRFSDSKAAEDTFRLLRKQVTEKWREKVDCMFQWCDDRRLLDEQTRLHHWLHAWLLVHVPLSFALLVLTIWHGYIALLYL
ncbi:MAG TPA: hypothetical protein VGO11_10580 [Chthoniobacteraceae bacterium]|nr:hypothetical protein [Chthoniobacteraceae bacterium]